MELTQTPYEIEIMLRLEKVIKNISLFLARYNIQKSDQISSENRKRFLSWPVERLVKLIETTEKILEIHLEAEQAPDFDLDDSTRLLTIALRSIGTSIDPEFYTLVKRTDILEVYDNNHIQIFRSFNFFRICNYNLDDILSHEWYELYERVAAVTDEIMEDVKGQIEGTRTITKATVQPHLMRERFSEARGAFITEFKFFASVYSGPEQKQGYALTIAAKMLGSDLSNFDFMNKNRGMNIPSSC